MYVVGQKVRLWGIKVSPGLIEVTRDVTVTITEIKTGVPGEFSRTPSRSQSLKAVAENGTVYEKHWESWPESQTNTFQGVWSHRKDDGEYWIPREAVSAYNEFTLFMRDRKDSNVRYVGLDGNPITPAGEGVVRCEVHNHYMFAHDSTCFWCAVDAQDLERAEAQLQ